MFNQIPLGGLLSVGNVVKVLEKRFPYVEVSSILGADSSYDTNRKVREWLNERMLPSFLCFFPHSQFFLFEKLAFLLRVSSNRFPSRDMLVSAGTYLTLA